MKDEIEPPEAKEHTLEDGKLLETKQLEQANDCLKVEPKEQFQEEGLTSRVNEYFNSLQPMEKLRYVCIFNFYDNDFDFINKNNPSISVDTL